MPEPDERSQANTVPGQRHGDEADIGFQSQDASLDWSFHALSGALARLSAAKQLIPAAAAAIEAVWWATAVDAALTRRHFTAYTQALSTLDPAARKAVERSFAGFRFVRTQLGPVADPGEFIQPEPGKARSRAWTWTDFPPPQPQRGAAREVSPYREYRIQLAGKLVEDTLKQASEFLATAYAAAGGRAREVSAAR